MRIGGLASGFDTEGIVKDLMQAERIPLDRVIQQKIKVQWQQDLYREFNTKVASFRDAIFNLTLQGSYTARTATSSNDGIVSVRATGQAEISSYNIVVHELATAATAITSSGIKDRFEDFTAGLEEPVNIKMRTVSQGALEEEPEYISLEIKPGDTLEDFVQQINSNQDLNMTGFYDEFTDSLVVSSKDSGNRIIEFDLDDPETGNFLNDVVFGEDGDWSKYAAGTNARLSINGLETERESNEFSFAGIQISLKSSSPQAVKIDVLQDTDAVFSTIKNFVDQYNALIDEIHDKLNEPVYRDYPPLTDEQKRDMTDKEIELWEAKAASGLLRSDKVLSDLANSMRRAINDSVAGTDGLKALHQIGITTGSWYENGKLYVNETKLRTAIEENPTGVQSLFTQVEAEGQGAGVARRLKDTLENGLDRLVDTAGKSTTLYDQSNLSERIRNYDKEIQRMEDRLAQVESRYWRQFSSMEKLLQQMYSQSDWLYQQMGQMMG